MSDRERERRVAAPHRSTYDRPVRLRAGEALRLTGRRDLWEGHVWLWAIDPVGREGWVPSDLPAPSGAGHVAAYDYSAHELDVDAGAVVTLLGQSHGWAWVRSATGEEGWLPLAVLAPETPGPKGPK